MSTQPDRIAQQSIDSADAAATLDSKPGIDAEAQPPRSPPVAFDADGVLPDKVPYASPAVRLFARELGVDLAQVQGSGREGRIDKEDVQNFVKRALAGGGRTGWRRCAGGRRLEPAAVAAGRLRKFGEIETKPLSRIQKITGANLARNWAMIPHVTQHDDADITELEALRVALNKENEKAGAEADDARLHDEGRRSPRCRSIPNFNASLDASGENLMLKKYFHIGFAADTPNGLVVPVVRDVDKKGVLQLAQETGELAGKAREGKLSPGRHERRLLLDQLARRHRRHGVHADHQRAGSRDPRRVEVGDEAGVGRQAIPAAAGAAAVAELRPPRDRRRRRRALHRVPGATARRHAPRDAADRGDWRMARIEVKVPDIGGYDDVPVIELLVAVGDTVKQDQGLVTLESDKATMEVPSWSPARSSRLKVKIGDKLSEGSVVAIVESEGAARSAGACEGRRSARESGSAEAPRSRAARRARARTAGHAVARDAVERSRARRRAPAARPTSNARSS